MMLEEGFAWNGQTFGSLSQIAKAMTGCVRRHDEGSDTLSPDVRAKTRTAFVSV